MVHQLARLHEASDTQSPAEPDGPADQALAKIADHLLKYGYGCAVPAWDGTAYLKISNVLGAVTDLTITCLGDVTWEYRSTHGTHVDPAGLVVIATSLLDPDAPSMRADLPPHRARSAIHVAATCALRHCGLTVSRHPPEPGVFTVLTVTNPEQPMRGTVRITDDGELTWHAHAPYHRDGGLTLPDVAASITRALARTRHIPTPDRAM